MGALDITKSSMGALTSFNDDLNLLSLPYLFKSEDHLWAVMNTEIGQNLLDSMESKGLVGLCWLDAGSRCFYATKPLNTVEDFKNVKFRVMQSSIYQDTVSALGAIPISMSGSEVYSALHHAGDGHCFCFDLESFGRSRPHYPQGVRCESAGEHDRCMGRD